MNVQAEPSKATSSSTTLVPEPAPSVSSSSAPPSVSSSSAPRNLTPPVYFKPSVSDSTVSRNKEARQSDLESIRQAKRDKKKQERRAKAAAAANARAVKLAEEAQAAAQANGNGDDDAKSFASNISHEFGGDSDTESIMSIQGEDPAPDDVNEMVKNAVKGNVDPRAWMGGWSGPK